jgi:hypothetical protein
MSTLPKGLIIYHKVPTSFHGQYKDSVIEIQKDFHDTQLFYITVTGKDGIRSYDGWAPKDIRTIYQAILDAIDGAQL